MKLKFHLVITDPRGFMKDPTNPDNFSMFDHEPSVKTWVACGEVEVEYERPTHDSVTGATLTAIDREADELRAKLNVLEEARKEVLALPAPGETS